MAYIDLLDFHQLEDGARISNGFVKAAFEMPPYAWGHALRNSSSLFRRFMSIVQGVFERFENQSENFFNPLNRSLGPQLAKTLRKSTKNISRCEAHPGH